MKSITCEQTHAMYGYLKIRIRFIDHLIFMKFNNNPQKNQMINNLRSKGAIITEGNGWLRINIVGDKDFIKLGEIEFEPKDKTGSEIEQIFFDFFFNKYLEAKFVVKEVKE